MKILSADIMAKIPRDPIKKLVNKYFKAKITADGVDELAKILENEAEKISRYAVENARKEGREKVTRKDIARSVLKKGLDDA